MITRKQAFQIIQNIEQSNGYRESEGEKWLGPRLYELRMFIDGLPLGVISTPVPKNTSDPYRDRFGGKRC